MRKKKKKRKIRTRFEDWLPLVGQLADKPECPNCGEEREWSVFIEKIEFCEHCFLDYLEFLILSQGLSIFDFL